MVHVTERALRAAKLDVRLFEEVEAERDESGWSENWRAHFLVKLR